MLNYITSNSEKVRVAKLFLEQHKISFKEKPLDLVEIQSDSIEEIAKFKAIQAFKQIQEPLFVNDSGWFITALNGFPGPYLRYMNKWFTSSDYLKMLEGKQSREVILKEVLCYIDNKEIKLFSGEVRGQMLHTPSGEGTPWEQIVSLLPNNKSMAACKAEDIKPFKSNVIWGNFATWYTEKNS